MVAVSATADYTEYLTGRVTVAAAGLVDAHVPPANALLNVCDEPVQTLVIPVMGAEADVPPLMNPRFFIAVSLQPKPLVTIYNIVSARMWWQTL